MQLAFDHLVWFFKKPEEAIAPLEQVGLKVAPGGRHESWGTYNTLSYFGLSYLEFLGIEDWQRAETHEANRLITHIVEQLPKDNGEGPARIAIRTNEIEALAEQLKQKGFTVYGPIPGERVRGDGEIIRWSLLFPEYEGAELRLPFFIQWEKSDEERLAELDQQGLIDLHPAGHVRFEGVAFAIHNLDETLSVWKKLLDMPISEEFIDQELNARCGKIALEGTELLFCSPIGEGMVAEVLKEKGETPFLVNLSATNQRRVFEMLKGYWSFK
ncbi:MULTISPECIES: VOC family protein [Neobacillus]|uniref:VOC family protein n=1 Tax=Neobacillus rhizophilus TaxID=2833579 RepID=A0A942UDL5_9BACI|nr:MULTISPECIES: VOC family protein [Neobacillus]MBS4216259.1 VOC family protein [Neobacillus rhizophilus]